MVSFIKMKDFLLLFPEAEMAVFLRQGYSIPHPPSLGPPIMSLFCILRYRQRFMLRGGGGIAPIKAHVEHTCEQSSGF